MGRPLPFIAMNAVKNSTVLHLLLSDGIDPAGKTGMATGTGAERAAVPAPERFNFALAQSSIGKTNGPGARLREARGRWRNTGLTGC